MGKRKERRLAAKSNAGRRVKLDLFAEPSGGDLGGSNVNDGVGDDIDSKHGAGLPNSPSSSGQRPDNPLLLLGQYSDDELEDDLDGKLDNSTAENSVVEHNDEVEVSHGEGCLDLDVNAVEVNKHEMDKDSAFVNINQNLDDTDKMEIGATPLIDLGKDLETGQVSATGTSDLQQNGDVSSGWQIVMHEESNQYYYWNTVTGETSWEIPEALAQASESANNLKTVAVSERTENSFVDTQDPNLSSGLTFDGLSTTTNIEGLRPVEWSEVAKNEALNDTNWGTEEQESGMDLSSSLVKHSESLIERLKSLKGSDDQLQSLDCISKYILEVEIRLSDIKSLSSFGSSLHQFWVHSERRLKQLEDSISVEFSDVGKHTQIDDKFQESTKQESGAHETGKSVFFSKSENSDVSTIINTSTIVPKDSDATNAIPTMHASTSEQVNGTATPDELNPKQELNAVEDVDMDVDMEVEDASSAGNTAVTDASGAKEFALLKQAIHPIQPPGYTSIAPDDVFTVPPPPDEEWIPPPPPDNEQIPPPPPDEPPEPMYPPPPSYPETGPPAYAEQYNSSYPNSSFEYYGHAATEVPSNNFYGQTPVYYGAVPNTYTETPQITVNTITPVAYYELQDVAVPPVPGVSSVETSQIHVEPAPVSYQTLISDCVGSVHSLVEAGSNSLPTANDSSSAAVGGETDKVSLEVPSTAATVQATAIVSAKESVSLPSTKAASATGAAVSATTKVQSKVPRNKKRTVAVAPSLRSNKKVSSLVDKWKAAKEELLEDEEEPENAYEMLERKRQREIEEWHAQQIASGEAKDNANFQPLGGDWRERVKRRRAQLASEAARKSPESRKDENQQQPDLTELSRDLPSGWQAYWDESSKQVYYGNVVTSETTWTKPTK